MWKEAFPHAHLEFDAGVVLPKPGGAGAAKKPITLTMTCDMTLRAHVEFDADVALPKPGCAGAAQKTLKPSS